MTKEELNIRINEIHEKYDFRCQYKGCDKRSEQIAHRVAKSESNKSMIKERLKHLGLDNKIKVDAVINHDFNVIASCSKHNDYFNIGFRPIETTRLITAIIKDLIK